MPTEETERIRFTIGGAAMCVAGIDDRDTALSCCQLIARRGSNGYLYEGARDQVLKVLAAIESCPAYSPPGEGGGGEGFGGEHAEVAAVRRASDSVRRALGLPLLGHHRRRRS